MTTLVPIVRMRTGSTRVQLPDGERARRTVVPASPRHRVAMVAACYAGLVMIVVLALLIRQVTPTPVAMPLFLAAAAALVGTLHPRRAAAWRTLRH